MSAVSQTAPGRSSTRSGGCLLPISSGNCSHRSRFLDTSESGDDVFFLTSAKLTPQDIDTNGQDVYDAHLCSTVSPCTSPPPVPPRTAEVSCRPVQSPQPEIFGAPASAIFSAPGNPASSSSPSCEQQARRGGACERGRQSASPVPAHEWLGRYAPPIPPEASR